MKKLILASGSPYRKELLTELNIPFTVQNSPYIEDMSLAMDPSDLAAHLATGKAMAVAEQNPDSVIIGADTFVVFDGKVIGKPSSLEDARETLKGFSGRSCDVFTGVVIIDTGSGKRITKTIKSVVFFRELTDQEIQDYVDSGEPMGRAGSFGIASQGAKLVERVEGDVNNVSGFPLGDVANMLADFGFDIKTQA